MKNTRALTMIALSILAAFAAVWVASRWVAQEVAMSTSRVVVAAQDIPIGSQLTAQMLRTVEWPASNVPSGSVQDEKRLVDRVTITGVYKDEPVLLAKLAPEGAKAGLSSIVAKGKRAITVKVNEVVGVAGFALPGNYVDVMVNTQEEGGRRGPDKDFSLSKIVLERILVLAVAQETSTDVNKPKVVSAVTLEVSPEEAEKLDLARSVGALSLVLRNQVDPESVKTAGATKARLLGPLPELPPPVQVQATTQAPAQPAPVRVARKRAPPPPPPEQVVVVPRCVMVITGTKPSNECFQP